MTQWEYISISFRPDQLDEFQDRLNKFGNLGWEMVAMQTIEAKSISLFDGGNASAGIVVVFKRPKE